MFSPTKRTELARMRLLILCSGSKERLPLLNRFCPGGGPAGFPLLLGTIGAAKETYIFTVN